MIGWITLSLMAYCQLVSGASLNSTLEDRWENDWDEPFLFQCGAGKHISRMESEHKNKHEDRRWAFDCRGGLASNQCYWINNNNYINDYDEYIKEYCHDSDVMVGVHSIHKNKHEDRRWKIKCCKPLEGTQTKKNCKWTSWINELDGYMNYHIDHGYAIHGILSQHENHEEDRQWKLYVCLYSTCTATSMKILDENFLPEPIGTSVLGIATMPMCTKGAKGTLSLSKLKGTSQSVSVTTETSTSFSIGASLTIESTAGVSVEIFEFSQTLSMTASTELTQTFGKSTTRDETQYDENAVGATIEVIGNKGAYISGLVNEYQFDMSDIPVKYKYKCTTDVPDKFKYYTENGKIKMRGHVYGHVHFDNHQEVWNSKQECEDNKECLRNLNAKLALSPTELTKEFKKCFPGST